LVLKYIAAARDTGLDVVLIIPNPNHAYMVSVHLIILKLGRVVLEKARERTEFDELIRMMAGGDELAELSRELCVDR
jgi:simple sugar transport system ATP-binding protein